MQTLTLSCTYEWFVISFAHAYPSAPFVCFPCLSCIPVSAPGRVGPWLTRLRARRETGRSKLGDVSAYIATVRGWGRQSTTARCQPREAPPHGIPPPMDAASAAAVVMAHSHVFGPYWHRSPPARMGSR